ncbi:hypothetical protein PIB30_012335 [Stylosanthes scabra]|uniref:Uncharacterized protein n=1 Tax=Stylosanthes scabra TaxID=79078 RepID=A0ABU6Y2Y3_9FABA|nr:hypothetical protein [Stylosanthes scabra]
MSNESDEEDGSSDVSGGNTAEGHTRHDVGDGYSGGTDETERAGNGSGEQMRKMEAQMWVVATRQKGINGPPNSAFIIYFIALCLNHLPNSVPCTLTTRPFVKALFPFFFRASTRHFPLDHLFPFILVTKLLQKSRKKATEKRNQQIEEICLVQLQQMQQEAGN